MVSYYVIDIVVDTMNQVDKSRAQQCCALINQRILDLKFWILDLKFLNLQIQ